MNKLLKNFLKDLRGNSTSEDRKLVLFKKIEAGELVYLNQNDEFAIFQRSDCSIDQTIWNENDKFWIKNRI